MPRLSAALHSNLRSRAVALLVFFAGAAGARIVAPDFRAGANRLGGFGLRGAGLKLEILLLAALALLDLFCFGFRLRGLHEEQEAHRFVVNSIHQIFKKGESLFLEFNEGILLAVSAKADAFFQMVESEEVVLPLRVHDIEQDVALKP